MTTQLLSRWKRSAIGSQLCLDLRSPQAYQIRHVAPSTNIPWQQLSLRCAELPPKNVPFAVIEPSDQKPDTCSQWLIERGWQCPYVFREDDDTFWTAVEQYSQPTTPKPWLLFRPCPFLMQHINWIEKQTQQHRCLDIGCGSGRDVAWLLSRQPLWNVYALDSLKGAVERTHQLTKNMGVHDRLVECLQAKITSEGKWKTFDEDSPAVTAKNNTTATAGTSPTSGTTTTINNTIAITNGDIDDKSRRFSPGVSTDTFFQDKLGCSQFDLILTIRFLVRSLLPQLPQLLAVGGYLVISHFVEDGVHEYEQPRKDHRLQLGELAALYGSMANIEIVVDVIEQIEDGRPVNSVVIKRTGP
ncbi:hypothetical protein BDB00DRAFT_859344 [Zychaea mexicana]|uniref:uncharacterized protein n=1 Tax=Zychaea mexicana TaxID=64656 RepID=UPI0022FEDEAE|nr:uncharacterized protein BDB00DRAFT_859344 [Zychaea mexicana]KAI9477136.1 hypothetical protein BDB00DRAFT_859344 [Zychaea mexicana]